MGVRGLTTFIDDNQQNLLTTVKLSHELVVIDGLSLYFYLYDRTKNVRCGGDYVGFRKEIIKFFENLRACHIFSVVVLDGAFDADKRRTQLTRLQTSVDNIPIIMTGVSSFLVIPILAGEVFQQTLEDLHIPFVYSFFDADRDVAAVANALDAYVLSKDSDFYVLPVTRGYISLGYFTWNQVVNPTSASPHIVCYLYSASQLASYYRFNTPLLSYLPAIVGCDYMAVGTLLTFGCSTYWNDEPYARDDNMFRDKKFRNIFRFFAEKKDSDRIIDMIDQHYKSNEKVLSKVKWCLDYYLNLPNSDQCVSVLKSQIEKEFSRISTASLKESLVLRMEKLDITTDDSVTLRTRCGKYPTTIYSVYNGNRTVLLPVMVGSTSQQCVHTCSYAIRCSIYQLITTDFILEYSQQSKQYCPARQTPKHRRCACQTLQRVITCASRFSENRNDVDEAVLHQYLLESLLGCRILNPKLHERLDNFVGKNREYELLLAATMHWVAKTKPPFPIFSAVLLALSDPNMEHSSAVLSQISDANAKDCNTKVIHRLSEWQSCIKYAVLLNRCLSCPLADPRITYSCDFIAALSHHMMTQGDMRRVGEVLLKTEHEKMAEKYNKLLSVLEPNSKYSISAHSHYSSKPKELKAQHSGSKKGGGRRRRGRR